ncbi:MAG: PAS domain S-box protein, partial [Candidatus Didemnitutus sp.]|nr:PAS domain S-box protein [Candidatus Didemnitutus sp.]
YEVNEARHGAEALVKARAAQPDLLISDLLMPVMDGYTLLRQWKLDARLSQIPFVVYTATYTEPKDEQLALDLGADAFIIKPAEPPVLMARLDEVLGRLKRGELAKTRLPAGDQHALLKEYSEVLIRKLEAKMVELEQANRALTADIATRTQSAAALRESEERLRLSTELAQVAVWEYHFADDSMARSSNHDRLYGLPWQEKWELNTFVQATHPDDRALTLAKIKEATAPGGPDDYACDFRVRHPDRSIQWLAVTGQVVERSGTGQGTVVRGCLMDVSARKHAETELRAREQQLGLIYAHVSDAVFVVTVESDGGFRFTSVNQRFTDTTGLPLDQVVGRAVQEILPASAHDLVLEKYREAISTRQPVTWEEVSHYPAGAKVGVVTVAPVFDVLGNCVQLVGTVHDITKRRQTEDELRASEARYRALFEHAPDGILIIDLQHRHLDVNASICRMLGYARDELIAMNVEDIVVPTETEQVESVFRSTESKKAYQQEWKLRRQDGSIFDADVIANLMPDGNLMAMMRDITDRKRAEQRIRQLNRTYAVLSEINQLIVRERAPEIILGDACRITVEQGGLMMAWIGLVDEADGQLRVSAHFGAGPDTLEVLRQLIGKGRPGCAFTAHALATGEHGVCNDIEGDPRAEFWREAALDCGYRAMISLPLTVFGKRVGTFNLYADQAGFFDADELRLLDELATDIAFSIEFRRREAERHEAGQKLREEQRLYAALSGATPDYIYFKDLEHRFIRISENLARDLGLGDSAEAIGRTIGHFLGEAHAQSVHVMERRILETGEPVVAAEEKVVWPDGRIAWISTSKVALRDDDGKIIHLVGISRDITEKKQLQEQFLRAQRLEAIGALSGGIAHDLNNILSPVILAANMLRMQRREAREEDMLAMIENAARRGADVIRQLLTFSRGVEGERIPVHLKHLIREMASMATETFPRNLTLVENTARDLLPILADATQMHQVLMNLCVNARDAMPHGGKLTIAARNVVLSKGRPLPGPQARPGSFVLVTVSDTGEGIPESLLERIFEPFFTTKELGKGSGLGLSTVAGIVRSHEGFVTVESKPQLGTTFNVYLPAQGEVVVANPVETAVAARGRGETLLVVDDETSILSALRLGLERQGYRVLAAKNGTEAIAIFSGHRDVIKLVVTDLMMPVMDGAELIRQLRAGGAQVPVIACSGLHDQTAAEISTEQVTAEFLPKPYDLPTLFEAVRRQLDLARRSPGATVAPPRLPDPSQG